MRSCVCMHAALVWFFFFNAKRVMSVKVSICRVEDRRGRK